MRPAVATVLLDIVGPLVVYYALHALGVDDVVALAASALPPLAHLVVTGLRDRRLPPIAVLALIALVAGLVAALVAGSPRELLARDALISAPLGLWMLATLVHGRPFCFTATQSLLPHRAERMESLWTTDAAFRRVWRAITAAWGAVGLADSALRVVMAYTLPVPVVPALGTALGIVSVVLLQVPTHVLLRKAGYWSVMFPAAPHSRGPRSARTAPVPSPGPRRSS
ncbi:VC0807 family protein [Actinomycetospora aeridis]|uniref:VC0807 family protein n=1 Tax=Actinomycetospora aeridis TaxID=3129231 RepID=A0ABU8NBN9_9PSEU